MLPRVDCGRSSNRGPLPVVGNLGSDDRAWPRYALRWGCRNGLPPALAVPSFCAASSATVSVRGRQLHVAPVQAQNHVALA
jgi:hypothetical protein